VKSRLETQELLKSPWYLQSSDGKKNEHPMLTNIKNYRKHTQGSTSALLVWSYGNNKENFVVSALNTLY
jgi:hypothetical protein